MKTSINLLLPRGWGKVKKEIWSILKSKLTSSSEKLLTDDSCCKRPCPSPWGYLGQLQKHLRSHLLGPWAVGKHLVVLTCVFIFWFYWSNCSHFWNVLWAKQLAEQKESARWTDHSERWPICWMQNLLGHVCGIWKKFKDWWLERYLKRQVSTVLLALSTWQWS